MMNIEGVIKALEEYLSARGTLDSYESSLARPEFETEKAREEVTLALAGYVEALAADVEALKQALGQSISRLNKLRAEQARLHARGEWTGEDLAKLLKTLTELGRKGTVNRRARREVGRKG